MPALLISQRVAWEYPQYVNPYGSVIPHWMRKVIPATPAPTPTDNPPFPGTRAAYMALVRSTWDLPHVPAQSKGLLKSFYNPKWDIPDDPPFFGLHSPLSITQEMIVQQSWQAQKDLYDFFIAHMLSGSPRGKRRSANIALLPPIDNPPLSAILQRRYFRILDTHYQLTSQLLYNNIPQQGAHRNTFLFLPPAVVIQRVGLIAFQPEPAFQIGYPRKRIAFQGRNRKVGLQNVRVTPFIRLVTLTHRNHTMEEHKPGNAVVIGVYCYDPTSLPERLFTPDSVVVTLYNPDGSIRLNRIALSEVETGFLTYVHQTSTSDQLGVYTGRFEASNFGNTGLSLRQELFRLIQD